MDERERIIQELRELVATQSAKILALRTKVPELELALAKAAKDSSNSSKPPPSKNGNARAASSLTARFAIIEILNQESSEIETYELSQDYFWFMFSDGVEPTINHS